MKLQDGDRKSENNCLDPWRLASYFKAIVVSVCVSMSFRVTLNMSALMGPGTITTQWGRKDHLAHILKPTLPLFPLPLNPTTQIHTVAPIANVSWPNKEGKIRWVEGQTRQNDGVGRQNKRLVDDCRQSTMGIMMGGWNNEWESESGRGGKVRERERVDKSNEWVSVGHAWPELGYWANSC